MYWMSGDSRPGWKYGGRYGFFSRSASEIGMRSVSRKPFRSSRVIFFIWCVALRAAKCVPRL